MNGHKDATVQQTQPLTKKDLSMNDDNAEVASDELSIFFKNLDIDPESITAFRTQLAELGLDEIVALRNHASTSFLQDRVGVKPEHVNRIMCNLFEVVPPEAMEYAPRTHHTARSIPAVSLDTSFLSKENVVILREIGHGASGRVFKALFVPTLTLVAVKYVEVKGAIEQRLVAQELKSLYQIALCDHIGGDVDQESSAAECTTEASGALSARAAHSPYVIGFYGAVSSLVSCHLGSVVLTILCLLCMLHQLRSTPLHPTTVHRP